VRRGEVELLAHTPPAGRTVMAMVRAGGVIADIPLLLGTPMPFDAVATRTTSVIELDRDGLLALLQVSPGLSLRWMASIAGRLDADRRRLLTIMTKDLDAQVAFLLLEQMEPAGRNEPVVRLSHAVMAQLLGARRQSISRVLRRLREQGLVATGYRQTSVLDVDALRRLAGEPPPR
jgi:CRP-like cAMP-binding protein